MFKKPVIYESNYDDMEGDMNNMLSEQMANNELLQQQQQSLINGDDKEKIGENNNL